MTNSVEFLKMLVFVNMLFRKDKQSMCGYDIYFSDKIKFENLIYAAINEQSNHLYSLTSRTLAMFMQTKQ